MDAAAIAGYVAAPTEAGLHRAYEIGRSALAGGVGVLDIASLHHDALSQLMGSGTPAIEPARMQLAAEFFAETMVPFEMSLRGYRESNARLVASNAALEEANETARIAIGELESFSYSVSHDLRAPLRAIDGYILMLLEDHAGHLDADGQRLLHAVRDRAARMTRMIDDILAFSHSGTAELTRLRVDMAELVRRTLAEELAAAVAERAPTIEIADLPMVDGDAAMLRRVWMNLLDNALKYTARRPDPRIEVGAAAGDGETVYFVRDNGAGFDMRYVDMLFGAFQRLHGNEFPGTGIGLANVKRIVTRHGGRVWAEGTVDVGATFYFALPQRGRNHG